MARRRNINGYTLIWAALAGAATATEIVALLDREDATLTHHVRRLAHTRGRQICLTAAGVWLLHHLALHDWHQQATRPKTP